MKKKKTEQEFLDDVRRVLDADAENLDASTRSRLNRVRQAALERAAAKETSVFRPVFAWGGAATAMIMLVGAIYFNVYRSPVEIIALEQPVEDFEIIAEADDLEFYSQIEFYTWLMEVEKDAV